MANVAELIFITGFALLLVHELGAIKQQEWRIFPVLSRLDDAPAYAIFVSAHIPLIILLLWLFIHPDQGARHGFRITLDIFFVLHLGLHVLFAGHEENKFDNRFSMILIVTMAAFGLLHLLIVLLGN